MFREKRTPLKAVSLAGHLGAIGGFQVDFESANCLYYKRFAPIQACQVPWDSTVPVEGARINMLGNRRWGTFLPLVLIIALALGLGCRKELPELFDRNQAPQTIITAAPVESLFDGFQVHLSWYGNDPDGEIAYFLWAWTDSSRAYFSAWNPETRSDDRVYRDGLFDATHQTLRTDSTFTILTNDEGGTARDVTFNISAVDDQGKRDPVPARLYFFGSVDSRPEIIWLEEPPDTLDAGESFYCRFTGTTSNGYILGYQWASGDDPRFEPRNVNCDPIWTYQISEDCDTVCRPEALYYCGMEDSTAISLHFANDIAGQDADMVDFYKFGTFLIKARCQDLAGVESELSTDLENLKGVLAPVLNRDPDTRLRPWDEGTDFPIFVRYKEDSNDPFIEYGVNAVLVDTMPDGSPAAPGFHYAVQDTLPWGQNTWVRFFWQGWDYDDPIIPYDEVANDPPNNPGDLDTLRTFFQTSFAWETLTLRTNYPLNVKSDGLYPPGGLAGAHESFILDSGVETFGGAGTSFEMNIATPCDYTVYGYSKDFFERVDGTPATVTFTGGFASIVDSIILGSPISANTLNLTELAGSDPVRIDLQFLPYPPPPGSDFEWDPGSRTVTIYASYTAFPINEFEMTLRIFGHDDERNGMYAQLGRVLWNMIDADYSTSNLQFVPNMFWVKDNESAVNFWEPVDEGASEPPAVNDYMVTLVVRDEVIMTGEQPTPEHLGLKYFSAKFCNTIESQTVTGYIEDASQHVSNLNNTGRVSLPLGVDLDIQYKAFGSPSPQ